MSASKSVTFRGEVFAPSHSGYASLILPFVACKNFLQTLFRLTLGLLWSELVEGKTADPLLTWAGFFAFCTLSLISYYGRAYAGFFLLIFFLLWFIDFQVAQRKVFSKGHRLPTTVECRGEWALWQRQIPDGRTEYIKFPTSQVAQISLLRTQVRGGAFQGILGTVWQVYLTLADRSEWLLDETWDTAVAFGKANQLSDYFAVPAVVLASEGDGKYAAEPLDLPNVIQNAQVCSTIRCQKSGQQWHIYSQWQAVSTWQLGGQILSRFGFLLFAVIVANLMIHFGGLLHFCGSVWFNRSAIGLGEGLNLSLRWQVILELAVALSIMVYKGAQISREEHLYITPDRLTFFLDTQQIDQVETAAIDSVLFLTQPWPSLLILAQDQAIEIRELQNSSEFRAMVLQLNEALTAVGTDSRWH
ncbi:MAG: hypothetical protein HC827_05600 [Cyanobacteria bacterium RM1_2_2]|nr:hypothetical protein [Cyanobacteria bacterium RM1_2_2]